MPFSSGPCATAWPTHCSSYAQTGPVALVDRRTQPRSVRSVVLSHPTCCVVRCTDAASHSARCWGGELSSKRRTLGLLVMAGLTVLVGEGPSIFFSEFGAGLFGVGLSLPESVVPANTRHTRMFSDPLGTVALLRFGSGSSVPTANSALVSRCHAYAQLGPIGIHRMPNGALCVVQ